MKEAKKYILYAVVVIVLSYAITYGMRIWQHNKRFESAKPFLEMEFELEKWQMAEGLSTYDFGTFQIGLPAEKLQLISVSVLPDGQIIDPYFMIGVESGSFKFSQPTTISRQKEELEKIKDKSPENEILKETEIRDFAALKETLQVKQLGYFEFLKLSKDEVVEYVEKVNEKASILQKAKKIVLFETEKLNGVLFQIEGKLKSKESPEMPEKPFAKAEITVWMKEGEETQKFIINGLPGKIDGSIEFIRGVIPSLSYEGKNFETIDKQIPTCLNAIKDLKWFKYLQFNSAAPESKETSDINEAPLEGIGFDKK